MKFNTLEITKVNELYPFICTKKLCKREKKKKKKTASIDERLVRRCFNSKQKLEIYFQGQDLKFESNNLSAN